MSYRTHITREAENNSNFRRVLFTGQKSQLVVMSIPVDGEVGEETHEHVEQTLYFQAGNGSVRLNEDVFPVQAGDVVVVTPGTRHNVVNTGSSPLKIATVYAPPNHIDGRVHATKEDADQDQADEDFGHRQ